MADPERDRALLRNSLLGWGLAAAPTLPNVDIGRDIALVDGPNGRDLARVVGMDNLVQDLTVAFTTVRGADVFNTDFGFDGLRALVEETNPILVRERVRISAIQVLRRDPRIRRVIEVNLGGGTLERATAGADRQLEVRIGFETVSGDQAAAELGRLAFNG
jgi:hypothetical protein